MSSRVLQQISVCLCVYECVLDVLVGGEGGKEDSRVPETKIEWVHDHQFRISAH